MDEGKVVRYQHLKLNKDDLARSLRYQNLAIHAPKKIVFPKGFIPRGPIDKRVMWLIKRSELRLKLKKE